MAKPTPKKKARRPIITYEPKGYEPKRIYQRLQSEKLFELLDLDPKYVPWMYVDNVVQRVFARTLGMGPYGPVPIKCSEDGSLFVSGIGGAYDTNVTKQGAAPDDYEGPILFDKPAGRVDIFTLDNKMIFKRSRDNVKWDDEIFLFKDSFYSIDVITKAFDIKNYTPGSTANYYIIGWYYGG
jgi:hypothetical protein